MKISELGNKEEIKKDFEENYNSNMVRKEGQIRDLIQQVIKDNFLLEQLWTGKVWSVYQNGNYQEYLIDCGNFGVLFDFKENLITTHT